MISNTVSVVLSTFTQYFDATVYILLTVLTFASTVIVFIFMLYILFRNVNKFVNLRLSGGVESDGPPKKLFVAGVTDPTHGSSYTVR